MTEDEAHTWLRGLHEDIWESTAPSRGFPKGMAVESRKLTEEEWGTVQVLVEAHGLLASMHNACMGFGCGMALYAYTPEPYPGTGPIVEPLCDITQKHFDGSFDKAWALFTPYTHSEDNARKLAEAGLPKPESLGYYTY